jgi:hypothetical protein
MKTRSSALPTGGVERGTRAPRSGTRFLVVRGRVVAMEAGALAEGARALAERPRGVLQGTSGLAEETGVLLDKARLVRVLTRSLRQIARLLRKEVHAQRERSRAPRGSTRVLRVIARDHVVKMRSLREKPRSPFVLASALLRRACGSRVLECGGVETTRPLHVTWVALSEIRHVRAELAPVDRTYAVAPDVAACLLGATRGSRVSNGRFLLRDARSLRRAFPPLSGTLRPTPDALRTRSFEYRLRASG